MTSRFEIESTAIDGLRVLQRKILGDARGYLERMFCTQELEGALGGQGIAQVNHTKTTKAGTVRGLHFQYPPHAEIKFVSCLRGEVFDVAVDLRRDSNTFLQCHGEILSADNHRTLIIPEGFAHGFQTLTADCEMIYFHTAAYRPEAEGALNAADPRLAIPWPNAITERSPRDQSHPLLKEGFKGIAL
jgi:dTDP-4-dehydrorhamnose 3,5-epimerase